VTGYHKFDWSDIFFTILWTIGTLTGAFLAVRIGIAFLRVS
jgi:hypothetical protein